MKPDAQPVDIQKELNDLLDEAMKQPGIAVAMELMEASEKYSRSANEYANYIDWQRFPVLYTSCNSSCPEPA